MSEFKQENGYNRAANVSAKPLSGAVPGTGRVMDWSKGDLKSLFLAPAAKEPVTPKATVTAAKLDTATPDKQTPQQDKPHAVKAEAATIDDDKQPEQGAVEAVEPKQETPKVKQPIVVPPQFAPVVAAGVLSSNQRAMAHAKPEYMEPESNFEFQLGKGGEAGRRARHQLAELERHIENDSGSDRNNAADLAEQYLAEQQQRAFMQTVEFAAAAEVVSQHIRQQELRVQELSSEVEVLRQEKAESDEKIAEFEQKIEVKEERISGLEETATLRDQYKEDLKKEEEMWDKSEATAKERRDLQNSTLRILGKDVYITVTEGGKPNYYKIDENGQKTKIEEKDRPSALASDREVVLKKSADGQTEYVGILLEPVTPEQKKIIDKALTAAGVKPEDVIVDRQKIIEAQDAGMEEARKQGVSDSEIWKQTQKTTESQERMNAAADRMRVPRDQLSNLEIIIQGEKEDLAGLIAGLEEEKIKNNLKGEALKAKETELAEAKAKLKSYQEFDDRLKKGEFKNEKEMIAAMPAAMRTDYEAEKAKKELEAKNKNTPANAVATPSSQSTAQAPAENTSRVNGSAAEPTVTASAKVGPPFAAAASGAPAAPAPEEPAPAPEMVAANQQQRNNLSGARLG